MAIQYYADKNSQDNVKVTFGDSSDLQIYHDSANSYIETSGSSAGDFYIKAQGTNHDLYLQAVDNVYIRPQGGEDGIIVVGNGAVQLFHNDVKKFETTTDGIQITDAEGTQIRFLESDSTYTEAMRIIRYQDVLGFHYGDNASEEAFTINNTGEATAHKNLTVSGGNITLGGTGRIEGVDTVSDSTDAANKAYVDAHDGGAGVYLPLAGGNLTGDLYIDGNGSQNFHSLIFHRDGSSTDFARIGFSNPAANNSPFLITSSGNGNEMIIEVGAGDDIEFRSNDNAGTTSTFATIGSNATFAGDITFGDSHFIGDDADDNLLIQSSANENVIINSPDDDVLIRTAGTTRLQITNTNATFAGNVAVANILHIDGAGTGSPYIDWRQSGSQKAYIQYADTGDVFDLSSDGQMRFKTGGENVALTIDTSQNATFTGLVSGIAPTSDLNFATKKYVDDSITGGANYLGTWDPDDSLNSGYGNPSLEASGRTDDSGDYFICSADGAAHPNGGTSEPDSWNTGDWVIWNEDLGTGGLWQKLDNTTVLSGAGTTNSVAKFTDSETIGDGPITFSSNDSTFAGNISAGSGTFSAFVYAEDEIHLTDAGTTRAKLLLNSSDRDNVELRAESLGSTMKFFTVGTEALLLNASQDATFAGNVDVTGGSLESRTTTADAYTPTAFNDKPLLTLRNLPGDTNYAGIQFSNNTGNYEWFQGAVQISASRADYVFQGYDTTTTAYKEHLRINDNSDVSFAGNVAIGALTSGKTAQLKVNNEGGVPSVAIFKSRTNKAHIEISDNDTTGYVSSENNFFSLGRASGVNAANINIDVNSRIGIGTTTIQGNTKVNILGAMLQDGKTSWLDSSGSALTTTGRVVAGLLGSSSGNGASALYMFTCYGGGGYQKIVYSIINVGGTWQCHKDIDEGQNALDVVASTPTSGSAVTFTFKGRSTSQSYTASVWIEHIGSSIDTQYIG